MQKKVHIELKERPHDIGDKYYRNPHSEQVGWFHGIYAIDGQAHVIIENSDGKLEYYSLKDHDVQFINQTL